MNRIVHLIALYFSIAYVLSSQDFLTVLNDGKTGIGTLSPASQLEISSHNSETDLRISASGIPFGSTRMSLISNKGDANEWRPGYIKSGDLGGFTGQLQFFTNGVGSGNKFGNVHGMTISNGRVGINKENPSSALEVNGFTKLGTDSPKIKMKKLTGITSAIPGILVGFEHELNRNKILAVNILIDYENESVPPGFADFSDPAYYTYYVSAEQIIIYTGSTSLLSKPVRILITYEE